MAGVNNFDQIIVPLLFSLVLFTGSEPINIVNYEAVEACQSNKLVCTFIRMFMTIDYYSLDLCSSATSGRMYNYRLYFQCEYMVKIFFRPSL